MRESNEFGIVNSAKQLTDILKEKVGPHDNIEAVFLQIKVTEKCNLEEVLLDKLIKKRFRTFN